MFLAFQANGVAYGVMVFWITIILGLLFGMIGYFAPEFLLLRLKETAAGAICGVLVASFVLVRREFAATQTQRLRSCARCSSQWTAPPRCCWMGNAIQLWPATS